MEIIYIILSFIYTIIFVSRSKTFFYVDEEESNEEKRKRIVYNYSDMAKYIPSKRTIKFIYRLCFFLVAPYIIYWFCIAVRSQEETVFNGIAIFSFAILMSGIIFRLPIIMMWCDEKCRKISKFFPD